MLKSSIALLAAVLLLSAACAASAADAAAGKALVEQNCTACHGGMMSMWQGKSAADIDSLIHQVVSGKKPHPKDLKPLGLTEAQIADIAAYWSSAAGK
jgi:mono/diheme cytochrome c family protein